MKNNMQNETREDRIERLTGGFSRSAHAIELLTDKLGDDYLDIVEGACISGTGIYWWWCEGGENVDTFADLLVRTFVFLVVHSDDEGVFVRLKKHIANNPDIKKRVKKVIDEHIIKCKIIVEE